MSHLNLLIKKTVLAGFVFLSTGFSMSKEKKGAIITNIQKDTQTNTQPQSAKKPSDLQGVETKLEIARKQFHQAVSDQSLIDSTRAMYKRIIAKYPKYRGRGETYLGALTSLKGKFNKHLPTKLKLVKQGIKIMEGGLKINPEDLESLYVYGSVCQNLPAFFNKLIAAKKSFDKIYDLFESHKKNHVSPALVNIVEYMLKNLKWTKEQEKHLREILATL